MNKPTLSKLVIVSFVLTFGIFKFSLPKAQAVTMSNDNFVIQEGNLNSFAGSSTGTTYNLGITGGELTPGLYSGTNYKVRSGFQYVHSIIRFQFSMSSTSIDFGTLSATNPVTRSQTLTVTNGSAFGYQVTGSENHPLQSGNDSIPDTTCDSGTCNQSTSSIWANTLSYGFGYRCDNLSGTDCSTGFANVNNYKHFADASIKETPVAVMTGTNVGKNKQATITYKVNIAATQAGGTYTNQINYVATPTF